MPNEQLDNAAVIQYLNRILELELAGVVRYTHYSFMVFGYGRIPIVSWLRGQAAESQIRDANMASETVSLTKNQILHQASNAMLAQANQQGQMVLQLLQ